MVPLQEPKRHDPTTEISLFSKREENESVISASCFLFGVHRVTIKSSIINALNRTEPIELEGKKLQLFCNAVVLAYISTKVSILTLP